VIVRRERPHPGAQLRFTDTDGHRFTAFITDTPACGGPARQHADLEAGTVPTPASRTHPLPESDRAA
jgi:hypothetical protein